MGGRGSCYLSFYNPNQSTSADFNLFDFNDFDNDEDTKKEYNGKTEKLKLKNIHIKESTDDLSEEIFIPNIKKVDSLTRKYKFAPATLKDENQEMAIRSGKLNDNVCAVFVSSTNFSNLNIVLNTDLKFSNREMVENISKTEIENGFWSKADKNEFVNQTITHEFGHFMQRVLMQKELSTKEGKQKYEELLQNLTTAKNKKQRALIAQTYSENYATKYVKQIQRIHRKEYGKESIDQISRYASTNNREFFAELFAHLNCSKNPNTLAKCLDKILKEEN